MQATLDQVQTPQDPYPTSKCRLKLFIPAVSQAVLVSFLAQMTFKMTKKQQGDCRSHCICPPALCLSHACHSSLKGSEVLIMVGILG